MTGLDDGDNGTITKSTTNEASPLLQKPSSIKISRFLNNTSPARFWVIFSQILIVQFIVFFDSTMMASSHPVITADFKAAKAASWLSTSFLLTSTAFQPLSGRLTDAVGRKPPFIISLVILALTTIWCALASNIQNLIAARAMCGLGGAGLLSIGGIIVSDLIPIERRGMYHPYINIAVGSGSASGAALGGVLAETLGWRWEFGIQVPIILLCASISIIAIPHNIGLQDDRESLWQILKKFDLGGSTLLAVTITFLILGLNSGGTILPWSHPFVLASLAISAFCGFLFVWIETKVARPIMPLSLVSTSPRANIVFTNFIAAMITFSLLFNMPLYFQAVLLTGVSSSGLRLMIHPIVSALSSVVTGFTITWTRRLKAPLVVGSMFYLIGVVPLCFLRRNLPDPLTYFLLFPQSVGTGITYPTCIIAVLAVSAQKEQAVVNSTIFLWRSLGQVLGIGISSLIFQNALLHYLTIFVHGEKRDEVITLVRSSVQSILQLEPPYQEQAIQGYEAALRVLFVCLSILAAMLLFLVVPVRLARLAPHAS